MARLAKTSYPGQWEFQEGEDVREYMTRTDALLKAIPADRLVRFPIADGYALYYVASFAPLVLQHVPFGDAWQIPAPMVRGLRAADVQNMIAREARLRALFAR